jgi:SAM-dependent methyltransferase
MPLDDFNLGHGQTLSGSKCAFPRLRLATDCVRPAGVARNDVRTVVNLIAFPDQWRPIMELHLAQRGRAMVDWEVTARKTANALHAAVIGELAVQGLTADTLPDDMEARHDVIDHALRQSPAYQARGLLAEWCAKNHGLAAQEAFDEVRSAIVPQLDALSEGPTTLETLPHFQMPSYFSRVWFHRTTGGWDAGDYNGFVHSKIVNERYVSSVFPGDQDADRTAVLDQLPAHDYQRVLEIGASSGNFTRALAERLPQAEIWGVDPSKRMLEQAQRVANEAGLAWKLFVGLGEDTRFEAEHFDLFAVHVVHHELPPRIIRALFAEAFRLLRPGGVVLIADVPPYRDIGKIAAWSFDWVARRHGEPYWRAAAMMDLGAEAEAAGFAAVSACGLGPFQYPYVVLGRKPK